MPVEGLREIIKRNKNGQKRQYAHDRKTWIVYARPGKQKELLEINNKTGWVKSQFISAH
jgi:hypothetical protein